MPDGLIAGPGLARARIEEHRGAGEKAVRLLRRQRLERRRQQLYIARSASIRPRNASAARCSDED